MADKGQADEPSRRNGKLKIPLPFDEAVRAAVETKPSDEPKKKPRRKKPAKR